MAFKDLKHSGHAVNALRRALKADRIHHAYLLEGADAKRRHAFAIAFAQALLCETAPGEGCGVCPICRRIAREGHVDLMVVRPDVEGGRKTRSIKTHAIEELQKRLAMKPFEGRRNVAIIEEADTMVADAENKFLKTLEEPPAGTVIMLLTGNPDAMLPTVLSRTLQIRLESDEEQLGQKTMEQAETLVHLLAKGAPYYQIRRQIEKIARRAERAEIIRFLDAMEQVYRDHLLQRESSMKREYIFHAVDAVEKARVDILRYIGITDALKDMTLAIGG